MVTYRKSTEKACQLQLFDLALYNREDTQRSCFKIELQ